MKSAASHEYGFLKGDVFVVIGVDGAKAKVGDVLIYNVEGRADPIIHRVIAINPDGTIQTKGDANYAQIPFEQAVRKEQIAGKAAVWAPKIGWVKVIFTEAVGKVLAR